MANFNPLTIQISLIGAGLVILALCLIWGLIFFIVLLVNRLQPQDNVSTKTRTAIESLEESKKKAAAAALAVAIALSNTTFTSTRYEEKDKLSPWQSVHRFDQIENYLPKK